MTILFSDVVGSTALAEQMDPEEWTEIMNAAFQRLTEPVERYGGTVTRRYPYQAITAMGYINGMRRLNYLFTPSRQSEMVGVLPGWIPWEPGTRQ